MKQQTYGNGTPQYCRIPITFKTVHGRQIVTYRKSKARRIVDSVTYAIHWYCDRQTTIPDCTPPKRRQSTPIVHAPDDGIPLGYQSPAQWTGEHPLNPQLVNLVSRIDYATSDEDMAQDMLLSLLQRSHTVRNAGDWRKAVRYALLDARRKAAQLTRTGESLESLAHDPDKDRRKEQLPGPIKPYDGPEPAIQQSLPTIPQHIVRAKVETAEKTIGQFRFNRECQVSAYVME